MWLASISLWTPKGTFLPTERWGPGVMRKARRAATELLAGLGNDNQERGFRMIKTLCVHRVVNDAELATCPDRRARFLAGSGVEELWRTEDFPELPLTAHRCRKGAWQTVDFEGHKVKIPGDCGECGPCLARKAYEEEIARAEGAAEEGAGRSA